MSADERRHLARVLAELDAAAENLSPQDLHALTNPYLTDLKRRRHRRVALFVSAVCCVILAGWIVVLAATLPRHFDAHHWRGVWVNFDIVLFAALLATAWAIWRERQVLILLLAGLGTMLFCDAWFDVGTSLATSGLWISLLTAVFAELPLAFLAFAGARRLLRATVVASLRDTALAVSQVLEMIPAGTRGPVADLGLPDDLTSSLRRAPLSGHGLDEALPRGRAHRPAERRP
jgi:uncharacterized BrkB/YihY/UPF0761 family membrane protein